MRDDLVGKEVALLMMGKGPGGEDDWAVFRTTVRQRDRSLVLEHERGLVELTEDWASRVRSVDLEMKPILLGADYVLPLTIGDVSDEEAAALERTGLKWPAGSVRREPSPGR